ncbi:hypothetical protein [Sandaracinobacteroides hominis]|mgnify:CR=1 FL=1|uniref:hypothetical protein n=1 Tax=Sandaracinobacteroides hominis TaxID=2780086 RepID=UPI0018F3A709|nr:hypothetical protein [Sandaracinobacteroides hominis]
MRAAIPILLLAAPLLVAAPLRAKPVPLVELTANPIPLTTVQLKRGSLPVRVSLGFDKAMLLNLQPALDLKLKPFPIIGKFKLKNPQLPGGEATIRGNLITANVGGTGDQKLPTAWIDKDVVPAPQAGVVSVMAFDADRVRIHNPTAPTAGTRTFRLARAGKGDSDMLWKAGREKVHIVFDFTSEATVMNAAAATVLEREGLVRRTGRVGLWSPVPALKLPVETLTPTAGAEILGLPLMRPNARITKARAEELDARAAAGITGDSQEDPDAIVVTAEKEKGKRREPWMLIGRDVLRYCSTVELDRPGAAWELTCAFPGQ